VPTAQINDANAVATASVAVGTSFGLTDAFAIVVGQIGILTPGETIVFGPEAGQVVVNLQDRDGDGAISVGDSIAMSFEFFGAMSRLFEGNAAVDVIDMQGRVSDALPYVLFGNVTFDDFVVTYGAKVSAVSGTIALRRELRFTARLNEGTAVGPVQFGNDVVAAGSRFARNEYLLDGSFAWFLDTTVGSSGLGGTIDVATIEPFMGVDALPAPFAGSLEARGRGGKVMLEVVDFAGGLEITLDLDDNSVAEQTLDATWDALISG